MKIMEAGSYLFFGDEVIGNASSDFQLWQELKSSQRLPGMESIPF